MTSHNRKDGAAPCLTESLDSVWIGVCPDGRPTGSIYEYDPSGIREEGTVEYVPRHLLAKARAAARVEFWKEIAQWKPKLHFCQDWDFLLIDESDPEFQSCGCFTPAARASAPVGE